jgi:phosphate-selective porin
MMRPVRGVARATVLVVASAVFLGRGTIAQTTSDSASTADTIPLVGWGSKGFELRSRDGNFLIQIQPRVQLRYAYPRDQNPATLEDFQGDPQHVFKVNRARLKIGGHAYRPWLTYFFEYELAASNLLDFRVMVERFPGLKLKVGQWKVHYNRERVISSGQQQMADRSLLTRPFTLDRQQGLSLYGRLRGGGAADVSYWASVFTGMGRGARENDDKNLMWMGRLQWNVFGRVLPFTGSDIARRAKPEALLALAAVTNRSPYTRFSQDGGGQLTGFPDGQPGQYRVNQWMGETAFMYRGFSWQQEFHWKRVEDQVNTTTTTLIGNYAQLGYFLHEAVSAIPTQLELAVRHAFYNPDTGVANDLQQELSFAANWFFRGHLNKLTAEVSLFAFDEGVTGREDGWRFRLQWDISM